jgi:MerR family transcriptional regulator, light-induced transcriptional regulator
MVGQQAGVLRIGELSRRVGVSTHLLRAWESRYGLLEPVRTAGGFRLYSEADESRVRRMQTQLARGLSAAEAARAVLADEVQADEVDEDQGVSAADTGVQRSLDRDDLAGLRSGLRDALDALNEPAAQAALDRLLTDFTVEAVLRDVVVPYLRDLGERWERGRATVAQEHFASNVIRGRLSGLARGWGQGGGPQAILACPPDELHDQALAVFGIALHRLGWRIRFLGASTPLEDLRRVVDETRPNLVVLAAVTRARFSGIEPELSDLAAVAPLALAGAGATAKLANQVGAQLLTSDPVTAAEQIGSVAQP